MNPIIKTVLSLFITVLNAVAVSLTSKIFLLLFSFLCLFLLEKKLKFKKIRAILIFAIVSFFSNIFVTRGNIILDLIFKRIKFIFPIFIPVFASCFRKAINIATAMECRCYGAPFERTQLRENKITTIDIIAIFIVIFVIFGVLFCNTIKIF